LKPRASDMSILVVDDHRFMQQVMRMMLNGFGVRMVVPALTVDDGLRMLGCQAFDIVIADYLMGGQTGAEFTRLARSEHFTGDRFVPIIACTADTTPRTIRELRDAGADEILGKPVSPRSVYNKILAVTNARRPFVAAPNFFGPDRRRRALPVKGDERRACDTEV
jgi:two-component system chemotaxis response regulator CheY